MSKRREEPIKREAVKRIYPENYWHRDRQGKTLYHLLPSSRDFLSYKSNIEDKGTGEVEKLGEVLVEPYSSAKFFEDSESFFRELQKFAVEDVELENLNEEEKEILEEANLQYD